MCAYWSSVAAIPRFTASTAPRAVARTRVGPFWRESSMKAVLRLTETCTAVPSGLIFHAARGDSRVSRLNCAPVCPSGINAPGRPHTATTATDFATFARTD